MGKVTNQDIADAFSRIADLLDILDEDAFRILSYRNVARAVGDSVEDVAQLVEAGRVTELPGVGKSSAQKITQMVQAGKIDLLEELSAKVPKGLAELLRVPGLGPKTVAKMWKQANITDMESLANAIDDGAIQRVDGMGPKKVRQIFESMQFVTSSGKRTRINDAMQLAQRLIAVLEGVPGAQRVAPAGSLRRGRETVGDIDILCQCAEAGQAGEIIQAFTEARGAGVAKVLAAGGTKASVLLERNVQADLRVVGPESYGSALQYFTGSKEHGVHLRELAVKKGWKLSEYGLFEGDKQLAGADEEELYRAMGMPWIPPELREDHGEIEAALAGRLPKLVTLGQIHGDLHMHTTASDGRESIETMIRACLERGYKYLAIADHSQSQVQANGLDPQRLAEHQKAVMAEASRFEGIKVYFSCEVDIFKDGSLDFPDKVLEILDFVVASPHSALQMKREEATPRIIKAIENPFVRVIGHPSGRLIGTRPGMELNIDEIAAAASEHGVALEVNAHPERLDLRDVHVRAAIDHGAKIIINTDSHNIPDLDNMQYGVIVARRGWATANDVVNAQSAAKFDKWVKAGR